MKQSYQIGVLVLCLSFAASGLARSQESCSSPTVIPAGTSGQTVVDFTAVADDHGGCGIARPGPDLVYYADGSNLELAFTIINLGPITETLYVDFTFYCHPDSACAASFILHCAPGTPIILRPTISQPIYVVVNAEDKPYDPYIPHTFQFNYSVSAEVQIATTTWGRLKSLYR